MAGRKKEGPKFSQFDEEFILKDLFGKQKGRLADIGARGRAGSNSAALIDNKWWAQLIDIKIDTLERDFPKDRYPRVTNVRMVVTPGNVNAVLWKNLELLSIDIDGHDCDVWEAIEERPRVLIIEVNGNEDRIMEVSLARGYTLHAKTGPNLIFVYTPS